MTYAFLFCRFMAFPHNIIIYMKVTPFTVSACLILNVCILSKRTLIIQMLGLFFIKSNNIVKY